MNRYKAITDSPEIELLLNAHSAAAQIPVAENHALIAFGSAGQNGFHTGEQSDGRDLAWFRADGAGDNQSVSGFQLCQIHSRHTLDHLVEVSARSPRSARAGSAGSSSRRARSPATRRTVQSS